MSVMLGIILVMTLLILVLGFIIVLMAKHMGNQKSNIKEAREKNELKESMETGNSVDDFNSSLDILRKCSKK